MDNKITIEQLSVWSKYLIKMVKEKCREVDVPDPVLVNTFFITLLNYPKLNRVHVAKSKVHGNGVFASRTIKKGEIITFYPAHYMIFYKDSTRKVGSVTKRISSDIIVEKQLEFDDPRHRYKFNISAEYSICGDSRVTDDPTFLGHIINDGARGHSTRENYDPKDEEIYNKIAPLINNAFVFYVDGAYLAILASKDINKDEEILMSYTYDYWLSHD